jgi:hypothetical protein
MWLQSMTSHLTARLYCDDLGAFRINEQPVDKLGKNLQIKNWLPVYDWNANSFGRG